MAGSSGGLGGWTEYLCLNGSKILGDFTGMSNPMSKDYIRGTLDYYLDVRDMDRQLQVEYDTSRRNEATTAAPQVRIGYVPRFDPSNVKSTIDDNCETGDDVPPCEETFTVDLEIQSPIKRIDEWQLRRLCPGVEDSLDLTAAGIINNLIQVTEKSLNDRINTLLVANVGEFRDGSSSKSYRILDNSRAAIWAAGEAELRRDLRKARYKGAVNIIGEGNWDQYMSYKQIGGLQDTGIQTGSLGNMSFYFDDDLASKLDNTNHALALEFGASHLITWNRFREGFNISDHPDHVWTTVTSPFTGLTFDLVMDRVLCGTGKKPGEGVYWDVRVMMNFDMFFLNSSMYKSTDVLAGVTGVYDIEGTDS